MSPARIQSRCTGKLGEFTRPVPDAVREKLVTVLPGARVDPIQSIRYLAALPSGGFAPVGDPVEDVRVTAAQATLKSLAQDPVAECGTCGRRTSSVPKSQPSSIRAVFAEDDDEESPPKSQPW